MNSLDMGVIMRYNMYDLSWLRGHSSYCLKNLIQSCKKLLDFNPAGKELTQNVHFIYSLIIIYRFCTYFL